jgi:hypothetical protein
MINTLVLLQKASKNVIHYWKYAREIIAKKKPFPYNSIIFPHMALKNEELGVKLIRD